MADRGRVYAIERAIASYLLSQGIKIVFLAGVPQVGVIGCFLSSKAGDKGGVIERAYISEDAEPEIVSITALAEFLAREVPDRG